MRRNGLDFTEGSIPKKMALFSWPIFLGNFLQISYQMIDSLWVGNLIGSNGLGAITVSMAILFTVLSFIIGINGAALTSLAQYRGAKDDQGLKNSLNAFVVVLGGLALGLGIFGFFITDSLLKLMGTPSEILPLAKVYLQINFVGIIFLFGYNFIATVLRALGDSKTPMRFILMAVILNAILDPIFIAGFDLGIAGAAYATIVSQGAAFLYGIIYCIKKAGVPFSVPTIPDMPYLKSVFKLGLPSGLSMMAISGGVIAIMTVVNTFGEEVVAGFGAAQRLDSLIMLPGVTLGIVVNSMAGQNIGAKAWERVNAIVKYAIIFILVVSFAISIVVFFSAEYLIRMFVRDEATIAFGTMYIKTVAFFYPFLGINYILNGVIRAAGAMFTVLFLNLLSLWIIRFPLTYFFATSYGEIGLAYGIGISFVISSFLVSLYYIFGKWRNTNILVERKASIFK